jgi:hypothetical protein
MEKKLLYSKQQLTQPMTKVGFSTKKSLMFIVCTLCDFLAMMFDAQVSPRLQEGIFNFSEANKDASQPSPKANNWMR